MKKAKHTLHIYTRVSTEAQATDGTSLETQKELGIEKAKELGFRHRVWNEGGASSNSEDLGNRPVLMALLREVEDGAVKHLFVFNNDRLSRNDTTAQTIRIALQRNDVILYTKDGKYDLTNATDKLVKTILDGIAQYDNALRAERSRLGKLNRVKNGFWHGGPPPFGYALKDGKLVIEPDEAKWVFKIFDAYASGSPPTKIKAVLDENGVSPRRNKGTWSVGSINALMRNNHCRGSYTYVDAKSGEKVEISCPRLIEDTLWFEAQDARREVQRRKGQVTRTARFYLIRDLMFCGHCDRPMSGRIKPSKNEKFYYCPNKERVWVTDSKQGSKKWKRGTGCGMDRSLNIPKTDAVVWDAIRDVVKNSVILKERVKTEVLRQKNETDDLTDDAIKKLDGTENRLRRELRNVEQSIAKVETDYLLRKIKKSIYASILQNLTTEMENVEAQLAQLAVQKREATSEKRWVDWVKRYEEDYQNRENLSDEEKKAYIEGLVTRLVVRLNPETREHSIDIEFSLPIVGDQLIYKDPKKKSLGYGIVEGSHRTTITQDFQDRPGIKKKALDSAAWMKTNTSVQNHSVTVE